MKYIAWTKYGPPEVLKLEEVEKPVPKDDEVLIKIYATTVTAGDCELRGNQFPIVFKIILRIMFGVFKPKGKVLGQELSGVIESVGKNVTMFKKGDEVFGSTGFDLGAYSEYKCMLETPKTGSLTFKPVNMSFEEAAAVTIGGLEALHFLENANVKPGKKVLINGAGGSIGTSVIQLVKHNGAEVTVVDRKDKLDFLKDLGADKVIDYTQEDFTKGKESYDVIFDVIGKSHFSRSIDLLNDNGTYIIANPSNTQKRRGRKITRKTNKTVLFDSANHKLEDLQHLKRIIEEGHMKTIIDKCLPLDKIVEAHRYVEAGNKKGNLVITISHGETGI